MGSKLYEANTKTNGAINVKIKNEKNDILTTIQATGKLEKEIEDSLIQIIEDYKKSKK